MGLIRKLSKPAALTGIGAALAYLFDPVSGRGRRSRLRDRTEAKTRDSAREVRGMAQRAEGTLEGAKARASGAGAPDPADDRVVVQEIKAVFSRMDFPTTDVTVEVVDGVATLRGQLQRPEHIKELQRETSRVPGVREVQSYLHLPNTPAPNKAEAIGAGASGLGNVVHHGA